MENDTTMGVGTTVQHTDNNQSITWEDVFAVCKLMGVGYSDEYDDGYAFWRPSNHETIRTTFTNPAAALEFLTAPEHPLEQKYANILRTKP